MKWWHELRYLWRKLDRRRAEEEFEEEIRSHLELEMAAKIEAGLEPQEAQYAARRAFGSTISAKERARAVWGFEAILNVWQDLRFGLRMMGKKPVFTAVAVFTLALGIGANTTIYSLVYGIVFRPLPYRAPEELVQLKATLPRKNAFNITVSYPTFRDWKEQSTSFAQVAAFAALARGLNLTDGDRPERALALDVSAELFPLLGINAALGRTFMAGDTRQDARVVVISHELWRRRFQGDSNLIGRTIKLHDEARTVIGIMPPEFQFPLNLSSRIDLWTLLSPNQDRESSYLRVVARLKPDVTPAAAQAEMAALAARLDEKKRGGGISLISLHEETVGQTRQALFLFLGAVGFVLLIACANLANLTLAQAMGRRKEMGIRVALGASRGRLVRQLLTESVMLSGLGGICGLLLAYWGTSLLVGLIPMNTIPPARLQGVGINAPVLLFTLGLSLLMGISFGLAPALRAAGIKVGEALNEGGRVGAGGRSAKRIRGALVIAEIAISLMLLIGAGLLLKSFYLLQKESPGFRPESVLTTQITLPWARYTKEHQKLEFFQNLLGGLEKSPGVQSVGLVNALPMNGSEYTTGYRVPLTQSAGAEQTGSVAYRVASPGYFRTMGIPLRQGRVFAEEDRADGTKVAIINEAFARILWPGENAVGQVIKLTWSGTPTPREIVGVVGDVRHRSLEKQPVPEVYVPLQQSPSAEMSVVIATLDRPLSLTPLIRDVVRRIDKDQPLTEIGTVEQMVAASVAPRRFNAWLLGAFAAVALALAAAGIYGVISHSVAQRTHEIGVRIALGARRSEVLKLVLRQGMLLAFGGVCAGFLGSLALARVLTTHLYGITSTDPSTFLSISALALLVALLACLRPAYRATKVDPIVALRYE
jgi:putative ABC transport system permease protein